MIGITGPTPDQKLLDDRPEGVSLEAAIGAWYAGYYDARNGREYHRFPTDAFDLQRLYSDGFERGERDRLHMKRINGRVPEIRRSGWRHPAPDRIRAAGGYALRHPEALTAASLLAGATLVAASIALLGRPV